MSISINHATADEILLAAAEAVQTGQGLADDPVFDEWIEKIETLKQLCPYRKSSTVNAAFGTAVLAKCVDHRIDVYSLLDRGEEPNSYSARSLADNVWAKRRSELDIDLGANGPNPLNNTPFIGKTSIRDITGVRNREGWSFFLSLLDELAGKSSQESASILKAFLKVRSRSILERIEIDEKSGALLSTRQWAQVFRDLCNDDSEEGRRAQSITAAIYDCSFGPDSVDAGKINDPDRNAPLDISVTNDDDEFVFAVEVKDKPIEQHYVFSATEKAVERHGVMNVAFLAVSPRQGPLDTESIHTWAIQRGVNLTILTSWEELLIFGRLSHVDPAAFGTHLQENLMHRLEEGCVSQSCLSLAKKLIESSAASRE